MTLPHVSLAPWRLSCQHQTLVFFCNQVFNLWWKPFFSRVKSWAYTCHQTPSRLSYHCPSFKLVCIHFLGKTLFCSRGQNREHACHNLSLLGSCMFWGFCVSLFFCLSTTERGWFCWFSLVTEHIWGSSTFRGKKKAAAPQHQRLVACRGRLWSELSSFLCLSGLLFICCGVTAHAPRVYVLVFDSTVKSKIRVQIGNVLGKLYGHSISAMTLLLLFSRHWVFMQCVFAYLLN